MTDAWWSFPHTRRAVRISTWRVLTAYAEWRVSVWEGRRAAWLLRLEDAERSLRQTDKA